MILRAEQISLRRGANQLLDRVSLKLAAGELLMVVGANGAGKTTLLRCLDGELRPDSGRVTLAQHPISHWQPMPLARLRAVLPQHSTLTFPFSVTDVVCMGRIPHPTGDQQNRRIAAQVLEWCDCAALGTRAYTSLSGGEQQRVQIARVLAQSYEICANAAADAGVLLLDEPVAALDLHHQYALLRLLKRISAQGNLGVICTLHDLNLVAQFADRVLIMAHGKVATEGAPKQALTENILRRVFNLDIAVRPHPDAAEIPLLLPRLAVKA